MNTYTILDQPMIGETYALPAGWGKDNEPNPRRNAVVEGPSMNPCTGDCADWWLVRYIDDKELLTVHARLLQDCPKID